MPRRQPTTSAESAEVSEQPAARRGPGDDALTHLVSQRRMRNNEMSCGDSDRRSDVSRGSTRSVTARTRPIKGGPTTCAIEPEISAVHGVLRGHVDAAIGTLRARMADPWTLNQLAEEAHLSRSQLVRAFDATVGVSPMAFLRQMRTREMARLLNSTDLSVAEVARSVGWKDAKYASRCFRSHFGVSPTEFRRGWRR